MTTKTTKETEAAVNAAQAEVERLKRRAERLAKLAKLIAAQKKVLRDDRLYANAHLDNAKRDHKASTKAEKDAAKAKAQAEKPKRGKAKAKAEKPKQEAPKAKGGNGVWSEAKYSHEVMMDLVQNYGFRSNKTDKEKQVILRKYMMVNHPDKHQDAIDHHTKLCQWASAIIFPKAHSRTKQAA